MLPRERIRVSTVPTEAVTSRLRVQRYNNSINRQTITEVFSQKKAFLEHIHYILYTRAKETDTLPDELA